VYAPVFCPSGVAAFGRDGETARQVWSSRAGYPGDADYRDFYRDIGFDLAYDYIRPYLHGDGSRVSTGIKYYRITGDTAHKEPYAPEAARIKARAHAQHFMTSRMKQAGYLNDVLGIQPIITAPYDAELFGHWWYEGPQWLDFFLREAAADRAVLRLTTPSEYLAEHPEQQVSMPALSSWGLNGYSEVWLSECNDWIYRHLHAAGERMVELARRYPRASGIRLRALNQAARELLLAQSSDWAFIMKTQTSADYAVRRTHSHLLNFKRLREEIVRGDVDEECLTVMEARDNLFPDMDYRVFY
jgi:1,4-alpha-glucan branching enzyme